METVFGGRAEPTASPKRGEGSRGTRPPKLMETVFGGRAEPMPEAVSNNTGMANLHQI
jgi:hypothetical protein